MSTAPELTPKTPPRAFLDVIDIDSIVIGERFRKTFDGIEELAASIDKIGLLQPIGVTAENQLVFGHRRLLALRQLGKTVAPVKRVASLNALQSEHDENVCRADFTLSEKVAIAEALYPEVAAAAKRRQIELIDASGKNTEGGDTRDVVAKAVDLSAPTLKKASAVVAAAKADPVKYSGVVEKMDATKNVSEAYRTVTADAAPMSIKSIPIALDDGKPDASRMSSDAYIAAMLAAEDNACAASKAKPAAERRANLKTYTKAIEHKAVGLRAYDICDAFSNEGGSLDVGEITRAGCDILLPLIKELQERLTEISLMLIEARESKS